MAKLQRLPNGKLLTVGSMLAVECCCEPCGEYSLSIGFVAEDCCCYEFSVTIDPPGTTTIVSYEWDFGDGSTSTEASPSHCYEEAGSYLVTVTTTDEEGCTKVAQAEVNCDPCPEDEAPTAGFSYEQTDGDPCCFDFTDESFVGEVCEGRTIIEWYWEFGDGATSTLQNPSHCYAGAGPTWDVTLTVTDNFGCEDSAVMEVVCYAPGGCCEQLPFLPPTVMVILPTPASPISACYCDPLPGPHTLTQVEPGSCIYKKTFTCLDESVDPDVVRTIVIEANIGNSRVIRVLITPGFVGVNTNEWSDSEPCGSGEFEIPRTILSPRIYWCNYTDTSGAATLIV